MLQPPPFFFFFFFNDTATTEIYTLSLHDALPIFGHFPSPVMRLACSTASSMPPTYLDRKSTCLNSSHSQISYAVFCLKKKKYNRPFIHLFSYTRDTTSSTPNDRSCDRFSLSRLRS